MRLLPGILLGLITFGYITGCSTQAGPGGGAADMALCPLPRTLCVGQCVDPMENGSHCGYCGNKCKYGDVCKMGQCILSCPGVLTACGDPSACVDTARDGRHCGNCDTVCAPGTACTAGKCVLSCPPGQGECDGACVNLQTDPAHCGDCATICKPGFACAGGNCTLSCQPGLTRCELMGGPQCVNLQTDPAHCGDCMTGCPMGSLCVKGQCMVSCQPGLTNCGGGCVNLDTDDNHCGDCMVACPKGSNCINQKCALACQMPLVPCKGACVDPRFDPANCGGCGNGCFVANGTPGCLASTCVVGKCDAGFADCDGKFANGCETNVNVDPQNCLGCNVACAPAHGSGVCMKGCSIASCDNGFADCDKALANGCEADLNNGVGNCGGCMTACAGVVNGAPACVMGQCAIGACKPGFADCDGKLASGCEANLKMDLGNCGICGNACPVIANGAAGCAAGKCQIASCKMGYVDCNGVIGDGCECNVGGGFACLAGSCVPISCNAQKKAAPKSTDGVYTIAPDGMTSISVYCDMTTQGGGWTLLMKLAGKDFCFNSANWTAQASFNEMATLDTTVPVAGSPDAKSRAFYLMPDVTALRFVTTHGAVSTTFASPSTAMDLMTTNNVPFSPYPDYTAWRAAFLQDRCAAPIFVRGGMAVTNGNTCRLNPGATPTGCGQLCTFCYLASDGCCCGCNSTGNDVSSGMGLNPAFCGSGQANCSTAGQWSDATQRTIVWGR